MLKAPGDRPPPRASEGSDALGHEVGVPRLLVGAVRRRGSHRRTVGSMGLPFGGWRTCRSEDKHHECLLPPKGNEYLRNAAGLMRV